MSQFNNTEEFWVNYKFNNITVIKKVREKDYKSIYKGKDYYYKMDILLLKCCCGHEYELSAKALLNDKPNACRRCQNNDKKKDNICNVGKIVNNLLCVEIYHKRCKAGRSHIWLKTICQKCNTVKHLRAQTFKSNECDCKCVKRVHSKCIGRHITPIKYFRILKYGANRRNIEVNITLEDILHLADKQGYKCALSGEDISFDNSSLSVDRIDSNKGYTVDNIQCVHRDVNFMKNTYSQERFMEICSKVSILNTRI